MKCIIIAVLAVCGTACAVFALLYAHLARGWMLSTAIACGTTAYHIAIRFLAPAILYILFRRKYDPASPWFREKAWESKLYKALRVRKWKAHAATFDPSQFDASLHTPEEIVLNMCHAEAVHELILPLSFTSLLFAIPFGSLAVFLITALAAALFDASFILIQRYNRPRLMRLIKRQNKKTLQ